MVVGSASVDIGWDKNPREATENTPWHNGKGERTINEWLAKRASDLEREKVANFFASRLNMPIKVPEKIRVQTPKKEEFRPDLNMSFGSNKSSKDSRPNTAAAALAVNGGGLSKNKSGMPPGMAPEGWGKTEVNVKPFREACEAKPQGKPKKIYPNKPKFAPTRALTSYEQTFAGSEVMPDMYEKVISITKAYPQPNLNFVSEWGNDMIKSGQSEGWKKKNLVTNYMWGCRDVTQAETNHEIQEMRKELYYRWARQKGLYYGETMSDEVIKKIDDWMRQASNEERKEAMEIMRQIHCVVDPLVTGAVKAADSSTTNAAYRPNRPTSALKEKGMEYEANKLLDGKGMSAEEAAAMKDRALKEQARMAEENRTRRRRDQEVAEQKQAGIMAWKRELLKEFTPAAWKAKDDAYQLKMAVENGYAPPEAATPPKPATPPEVAMRRKMEEKTKEKENAGGKSLGVAKRLCDAYASQINLEWGSKNDPDAGKSSYFISHGDNIPGVMAVHKERKGSKLTHVHWSTPGFGSVNYKGYESTNQPKEYKIPRCYTDGLTQEQFAAAFNPTPNMKKLRAPPTRPLRPTSSSCAGSAARRDPAWAAAAIAARRAAMSARPNHLKSMVPLGNQGLRTRPNWNTTYGDTHTGRNESEMMKPDMPKRPATRA